MPDLNTVPPSPHALAAAASRRQSTHQTAAPTMAPSSASALNILPSNQNALGQQQGVSPTLPSPLTSTQPPLPHQSSSQDNGVGPGPGPLRHPRPLTASELHMQLEKEQEAVVNRLTRELSLLRAAHNASVVSNTSSTSAATSTHDAIADSSLLSGSGFSIPTSRRHHRTSSSTSQTQQLASSYEGRSQISRPPHSVSLSRQNSAASRRSQTGSPAPPSSLDPSSYFQSQRIPNSILMSSVVATPGSSVVGDQMSPGILPATMRYEETAFYRNELETAKKENEALKRRIRELERVVRDRRASDASRPRSDSVSTTASASITPGGGVSIAGPRDIPRHERERTSQIASSLGGGVSIGVPDDEVKVGESAATGRLAHSNR
ncbi:hypothetical protein PT974_03635 [Cladobotryum mycophilum]|uniref:Uncharacterized protein n=1 Tax=Cladobotryum mycophilum TaxID=491253 RepID=A0ABR0STI0_9HYPO